MAEKEELVGSVESVIFQNEENGYAVFSIDQGEEETVCVGVVPQLHPGENLKLYGNYMVHPSYGKQFKVEYYEKNIPSSREGMEKYLASGMVKGIGKRTAKKIVDRFGDQTFDVIEDQPERLAEIKGLPLSRALAVHEIFMEQYGLRKAMIFLQQFGLSATYATKIFKKYKDRTFEIVKTNPYRLAEDIFGIGFKMADRLAAESGVESNSPFRIKAGLKYVLSQGAGEGHVFLPREQLFRTASQLLSVAEEEFSDVLLELQMEGQIWQDEIDGVPNVYLNIYHYAELYVAKKLLELSEGFRPIAYTDIEKAIDAMEQKANIKLADNQRRAVKEAIEKGLLIITGGPGTGKTTTINTMIQLFLLEEKKVVLAAPTGRAAKRMTETTGVEAQTIHRLLGISFLSEDSRYQTFDKDEDNPIEADVLIVDESSMIDIMLMNHLLHAVEVGTRVIFVGDVDQLPSVGPGNVLKDMIRSECVDVVYLNEIFRQAQESAIIMNAHRINQGEYPLLNEKEKDFFFLRRTQGEEVVAAIKELLTKRLPNFTKLNSLREMQVLTPMRKGPVGVDSLNDILQAALNPPSKKKKEKELHRVIFRENDKVMQVKNNYNIVWKRLDKDGYALEDGTGVYNGDEGVIQSIDDQMETVTVLFDEDKFVTYDYTQTDELELAYAITIHKSQGSEYPVVIIPVYSGPPMLLSRNLLYTAVTRARKLVVLVGAQSIIERMVDNNREVCRFSSLGHRIRNHYEFIKREEGR